MHALDQTQSVPEGHCRKSQTATVTPAKPGDYPFYLCHLVSRRSVCRPGRPAALLTRNRLDWTAKYPDVAAAIGALNCRQAYVDGELCAVLPDGTTSFSGCSKAKRGSK